LTDPVSHISHQNMWDIHAHALKHGMDTSHVSMVARTLTCCHESEATSSNMLLVVIQIISLRQTVIVMMNLWYCNCEANFNCDDELMVL
jgi:hypothetical protein